MNERNHKKRFVAFLLVFTMLFSFGSFFTQDIAMADDDPLAAYREQHAIIANQLATLKNEVNSSKSTLNERQKQLRLVDAEIEAAEAQLSSLQSQLANANHLLDVINNELSKSQENLSNQLEGFSTRLREYYMTGDISMLDVFFESSSMDDFITMSYYMEKLLAYDKEMMDAINARINEILEKRAAQEKMIGNIEVLAAEQETVNLALASKRAEKSALVAEAKEDYDAALDTYDEMLETSKELESKIQQLIAQQGGGSATGTGKYVWPLPSKYKTISSDYGMRWHPTKHVYKLHTGIDMPAPKGTNIYAADAGTVILSQYYGSYGYCVIINHGNGIQTLYGHMSKLGCKVGDVIAQGQTIGYVGTTGASTGNHLHFEVRKNGSCVNPWGYVSK